MYLVFDNVVHPTVYMHKSEYSLWKLVLSILWVPGSNPRGWCHILSPTESSCQLEKETFVHYQSSDIYFAIAV